MRLDKYLCDALGATRKEATKIIKSGDVTVNDVMQKSGSVKVTDNCVVEWQGREIQKTRPSLHYVV